LLYNAKTFLKFVSRLVLVTFGCLTDFKIYFFIKIDLFYLFFQFYGWNLLVMAFKLKIYLFNATILAKIGFSLFRTWSSTKKYVCMGDYGLFSKFMGPFRAISVPIKLAIYQIPLKCGRLACFYPNLDFTSFPRLHPYSFQTNFTQFYTC
jgi:hypothetical protein